MLIKGTRMIVITKNKIIAAGGLFLLLMMCVIMLGVMTSKENITAFSSYKNIIDSEIVPARNENKQAEKAGDNFVAEKEKGESNKVKESLPDKILRHFFVLGKAEIKSEDASPKPQEGQSPQTIPHPVLKAESVTIDKGIKVSNSTGFNVNPKDFIGLPLAFSLDNSGPEVLIIHTHTTESFSEETYVKGAPDRNLDEAKNITAVGVAMAEVFKRNGIGVIHDKTVHDYPSYNGAYQKAAATINKNLTENKGIKVVLDVHRDGITRDDGTKVKLVTDINGKKTAQIMLVVGTNVNLQHDSWQENFKLASKIQAKAADMFPSLMRPIDLRQERFNEQLTKGSLIVEVGSNGNTMEEAIRGGEAIAETVCKVIKGE